MIIIFLTLWGGNRRYMPHKLVLTHASLPKDLVQLVSVFECTTALKMYQSQGSEAIWMQHDLTTTVLAIIAIYFPSDALVYITNSIVG